LLVPLVLAISEWRRRGLLVVSRRRLAVDSAVDWFRHYPATRRVNNGRSRCPSTIYWFLTGLLTPLRSP